MESQIIKMSSAQKQDQFSIKLKKASNKVKIFAACTIFWIIFTIAIPFIWSAIFDKIIASNVTMTKSNENMWAHVPGETETHITRNYSFFQPINFTDTLMFDKKPSFQEIKGYQIQQLQDFVDIKYSDNQKSIKFNWWLHFGDVPTRDLNQQIQLLNLVPLGLWYQIKNGPPQVITLQGFGQLIFALQDAFKDQILGQGIAAQFLVNFSSANAILKRAGIQNSKSEQIWNDRVFGWKNTGNIGIWLNASRYGIFSGSSLQLKNYFGLTYLQMTNLLIFFSDSQSTLNSLLFDNFYCKNQTCDGKYLVALQLSQSGITNNPPPVGGVQPDITFCSQNDTCQGYPQISAFLKKVFPQIDPDKKYQNLKFSTDLFKKLLNHSTPHVKNQNTLLHKGNLQALFGNGSIYDKSDKKDMEALQNIRIRFELQSNQHSYVFWQWIKYISKQFINKESQGGNSSVTGLGGLASVSFYQTFASAKDNILLHVASYKLLNQTLSKYESCELFVESFQAEQQKQKICSKLNYSQSQTYSMFIQICQNPYGNQWQAFRMQFNLQQNNLNLLCDENSSIGILIKQTHSYLKAYYQCNMTSNTRCTTYQIVVKQWFNSTITLDPIPELPHDPSFTFNTWFKSIPSFEYKYFTEQYQQASSSKYQELSFDQSVQLLNFDRFFSAPMVQKMFVLQNQTQFERLFVFKQKSQLRQYYRWIMIHLAFKDLRIKKKVNQFLFGYHDQILQQLKNTDPAMGGDPSINSLVHYNDLNITQQQAGFYPQEMWTGKGNAKIARYYKTINGKQYTSVNITQWNGNQTVHRVDSPFLELDYFVGTDSFQNAYRQNKEKNVSLFITNLFRYGRGVLEQQREFLGQNTYYENINEQIIMSYQQYPQNRKYSQGIHGFFNMTNITQSPVFISKNHFYDAINYSTKVDIYDQNFSFIFTPNKWDNSYLYVEVNLTYQPYSGVCFSATVFLQSNYLYEKDLLFETKMKAMLPIFSVYRSANISQKAVNSLFKPLSIGIKMNLILPISFAVITIIFIIVLVIFFVRYRKVKNQGKKYDLQYSLQGNDQNDGQDKLIIKNKDNS